MVVISLVVLRFLLTRFRRLPLIAEDVALIAGSGESRKLGILVRVLRIAGVAA
jgi:hypothetical protein